MAKHTPLYEIKREARAIAKKGNAEGWQVVVGQIRTAAGARYAILFQPEPVRVNYGGGSAFDPIVAYASLKPDIYEVNPVQDRTGQGETVLQFFKVLSGGTVYATVVSPAGKFYFRGEWDGRKWITSEWEKDDTFVAMKGIPLASRPTEKALLAAFKSYQKKAAKYPLKPASEREVRMFEAIHRFSRKERISHLRRAGLTGFAGSSDDDLFKALVLLARSNAKRWGQ